MAIERESTSPLSANAETGAAALKRRELDLYTRKPRSPWQLAWTRFKRAKLAIAGAIVFIAFILAAIFAAQIAPYGQNDIDLFSIKVSPGTGNHLIGTDELGRDVFSRLLFGARLSLWIGTAAALISTVVGLVFGAIAGYYGGWIDSIMMRFVDLCLAFPSIFLLLVFFSVRGRNSVTWVIVLLGIFGWMWLARIIRGEFMSLKQRDFVEAARMIGAPSYRIIFRHLMPNVTAAIIVSTTLNIAYYMLSESALSFLGFGVPSGTPTWGNMLNGSKSSYLNSPWLAIAPGLTLTIAVLAINFIGDGLRDAFDPKGSTR
jgi:peptide/nickel transport system permease protein